MASRASCAQLERLAGLAQLLQGGGLLGGQLRRRLRQIGFGDGFEEGRRLRAGLVAGAGRHDGVEHLAPAAQVVVGHPARQAQQVVGQQRLVVEDAQQCP